MNEINDSSIFQPAAIATLANEHALDDLQHLLYSITLWNTPPPIYIYCTEKVEAWLKKVNYPGPLYTNTALEPYEGLSREVMEKEPSKKDLPNRFYDFTQEKCELMSWAMNSLLEVDKRRGVLFCDADICWLGPLPKIPKGKTLGLSRHNIRSHDEKQFGKYNAGFVWMNDPELPLKWAEACETSRFFEQVALETLEDISDPDEVYYFGKEFNYGWWRLFQSNYSSTELKKEWSLESSTEHSGLLVKGKPLSCIHTHFKTTDYTTNEFNKFVISHLKRIRDSQKVTQLLRKL